MANDGPAAAASPPPTVDPQDPLPDPSWFWRRIFIFGTTIFICVELHRYGDRFADVAAVVPAHGVPALRELVLWLIWVILVQSVIYLIAPSAEQFGKWLATLAAWKGGVSTTSTSRATAPDGSVAEATTSGGKPAGGTASPAPALPAEPAAPAAGAEPDIPEEEKPDYARNL